MRSRCDSRAGEDQRGSGWRIRSATPSLHRLPTGRVSLTAEGLMIFSMGKGLKNREESLLDSVRRGMFLVHNHTV